METKEYDKITLDEMQSMLASLEPWDNKRRMPLVPFEAVAKSVETLRTEINDVHEKINNIEIDPDTAPDEYAAEVERLKTKKYKVTIGIMSKKDIPTQLWTPKIGRELSFMLTDWIDE